MVSVPCTVQASGEGAGVGGAARLGCCIGCRQGGVAAALVRFPQKNLLPFVRRDLIEHRGGAAVREERLQVRLREVADANVANKPPKLPSTSASASGQSAEPGLETGR